MKLYNWQFAPNCRRVRMFVLEKNLDLPAIEEVIGGGFRVGSSRVDLQACKLEYSIVSPK